MYVIETMLNDGPHWFSGIRRIEKDGAVITGPEWTPYWEDARKYSDSHEAEYVLQTDLKGGMEAAKVMPIEKAMSDDARHFKSEDGSYSIRAKYLTPGLKVFIPGFTTMMTVREIKNGKIILNNEAGNNPQTIGSESRMRVIVVGKVADTKLN